MSKKILNNILRMSIPIIFSKELVDYNYALSTMQELVKNQKELIWGLEHFDVYTAGTSAVKEDILLKDLNVITTNRGGKHTYHGPGQLVIYIMCSLKKLSISDFLNKVLNLGVSVCEELGLKADIDKTLMGVWVEGKKIMSVGIRVSNKMTYHGLSFNVNIDLSKFKAINPCGLDNAGVTSLLNEGIDMSVSNIFDLFKKFIDF